MHNQTNKKYIITGGPCSGKSTLIEALRNQGFSCFNEIARKVIQQEIETGTLRVPWLALENFSLLVLEEMIVDLAIQSNEITFYDRGIVDIIAYLINGKKKVDQIYYETLKKYPVNTTVFFCPPWEEIYRNDEERKESFSEAEKISSAIYNAYEELGFTIKVLPKLKIEERISIIEELIF